MTPSVDALHKPHADFATMPGIAHPITARDDFSRAWWPLNDAGNGQRFVARHSDRFLYVRDHGWFMYDGKAWVSDGAEEQALRAAEETARAITLEAEALKVAAERANVELTDMELAAGCKPAKGPSAEVMSKLSARVKAWSETSGGINRANGMLQFAEARLVCERDAFDADPYAFNVQNGTLRFYRDEDERWAVRLHQHNPSDRITHIAAVRYDPSAACPQFDAMMERTFPDMLERRYAERVLSYSLIGEAKAQAFFLWQGPPGSGKSALIDICLRVIGSYGITSKAGVFLESKHGEDGERPTPFLAKLATGKRLVCVEEPPKGSTLNEGLINSLTSGKKMAVRTLRTEPIEFRPCAKLLIEANHMPRIASAEGGIWRRMQLLRFRVRLSESEMIRGLAEHVADVEASGVLNRLIQGALSYLTGELRPPNTIRSAVADYRQTMDPFRVWLDEFIVADAQHVCEQQVLYNSYKEEMEHGGYRVISSQSFYRALSELDVLSAGRNAKARMRRGLRLLSPSERLAKNELVTSVTPVTADTEIAASNDRNDVEPNDDSGDADNWRYEGD